MDFVLRGAYVFKESTFEKNDLLISNGSIVAISPLIETDGGSTVFNFNHCFIFPGFVDVHVHLREPGFLYKETMATGTAACARGGYTSVCSMPNVNPVPDSIEHLQVQLDAIRRSAAVRVYPYGALTVGERGEQLADLAGMAEHVAGFSDDGRGVQSRELMREAMLLAKKLRKPVAAHCEDNALLRGGYIHDGAYARLHGHKGICSESEYGQLARDLELVRETGCAYHVCHVSAKESVALIRAAKAEGLDVSCETAPHYLVLDDSDLQEDGRFKMNPPLRSPADRQALLEGVCDGTIDMIATDHAPHSAAEKSRGLKDSLMGVTGIETAFPVLYTRLVRPGVITLERLVQLLHTNPSRRFRIGTPLAAGMPADLTVFDLEDAYEIRPEELLSMGKSTPFAGTRVYGRCRMTMVGGEICFESDV